MSRITQDSISSVGGFPLFAGDEVYAYCHPPARWRRGKIRTIYSTSRHPRNLRAEVVLRDGRRVSVRGYCMRKFFAPAHNPPT